MEFWAEHSPFTLKTSYRVHNEIELLMHPHSELSSQNDSFCLASPLFGPVLERKLHEQYTFFGSEGVNNFGRHTVVGMDIYKRRKKNGKANK